MTMGRLVIGVMIATIFLCNTAYAYDLEDSTVYDKNSNTCTAIKNGMEITIEPCVAQTITGKNIKQDVTFKWDGAQDKNVDWFFAYDKELENFNILYDTTKTITKHEETCEEMQYPNGTPYNDCTIYSVEDTIDTTIDITDRATYSGVNKLGNQWSVYKIFNQIMVAGKEYETHWIYTPKNKKDKGKWRIFGKLATDTIAEAVANDRYMFIDPWWNSSWSTKLPINLSVANGTTERNYTVRLNVTYREFMQTDFDDIRFVNGTEDQELSYWIRNFTASDWADVYLLVDDNITESGYIIYMYYGNDLVTNASTYFLGDTIDTYTEVDAGDTMTPHPNNNSVTIISQGTKNWAWFSKEIDPIENFTVEYRIRGDITGVACNDRVTSAVSIENSTWSNSLNFLGGGFYGTPEWAILQLRVASNNQIDQTVGILSQNNWHNYRLTRLGENISLIIWNATETLGQEEFLNDTISYRYNWSYFYQHRSTGVDFSDTGGACTINKAEIQRVTPLMKLHDPEPVSSFGSPTANRINQPQNITYNTTFVPINVTTNTYSNISYSLDGAANVSLANDSIGEINGVLRHIEDGYHNITFFILNPTLQEITVYFTVNSTARAKFISSIDGSYVNDIEFSVFNFTERYTTTTSNGRLTFNWSSLPRGSIKIEFNSTAGNYQNGTETMTLDLYDGFNETFELDPSGVFNISVFDELTKDRFNFSVPNLERTVLNVYCGNEEFQFNVTNGSWPGFLFNCTVNEARLQMFYSDATFVMFRSLIPDFAVGELRFFMVENLSESLVYLQTFQISDLVGTYKDGKLVVQKLINASLEVIHEQRFPGNGLTSAYLVDGERYTLKIVSEDGLSEKTLPTFSAIRSNSGQLVTLEATDLPFAPRLSVLYDNVYWTFSENNVTNTISVTYRDNLNGTTSITYTVSDAANMSRVFCTTTSTDRRKQYDFTCNVGDINTTFHAEIIVVHNTHGTFTASQLLGMGHTLISIPGVDDTWLPVVALFLVIMTGLLFGAKHAGIGGLVLSGEILLFWYIGWIDQVFGLIGVILGIVLSVITMMNEGERR